MLIALDTELAKLNILESVKLEDMVSRRLYIVQDTWRRTLGGGDGAASSV